MVPGVIFYIGGGASKVTDEEMVELLLVQSVFLQQLWDTLFVVLHKARVFFRRDKLVVDLDDGSGDV